MSHDPGSADNADSLGPLDHVQMLNRVSELEQELSRLKKAIADHLAHLEQSTRAAAANQGSNASRQRGRDGGTK